MIFARFLNLVTAAAALIVLTGPTAAVADDVPSCYTALRMARPALAADLDLFVLVDQTVLLDESLKHSVVENVGRLIGPNTYVSVIKFSAFSQGRYLDVAFRGGAEPGLNKTARNATGATTLGHLDACLGGQLDYTRKRALGGAKDAMDSASGSLARSDILASLKEASQAVRDSHARRRVLVVVSDMLENSSVTSFYRKNGLRLIDPKVELARVQAVNMIGDFHGADVYVIGGALMGDSGTAYGIEKGVASYRDPVSLEHLRDFWRQVFEQSNAHLVEFGTPALVEPIH